MSSMSIRLRRSALYVPGSNARALEKSKTIDADCLILDLEDPVAPDIKRQARDQVSDIVKQASHGHREVVVRINALGSEWGHNDLKAVAEAGPDAMLIPKVGGPEDLIAVRSALAAADARKDMVLWAMMETPFAILNAQQIAAAAAAETYPLEVFVMGTNDLAKESRAMLTARRNPMLAWLSTSVLAARAYGLDVLDGVYNNFRDDEGFRAEAQHGCSLGMDGKTLIHPSQIGPCNEIFAPSEEEVAWSRKIVEAFQREENLDKGAIELEGQMVERLHAEISERLIALAEAIAERSGEVEKT